MWVLDIIKINNARYQENSSRSSEMQGSKLSLYLIVVKQEEIKADT